MSSDESVNAGTGRVIQAEGHASLRAPERSDGYSPITDAMWTWAAILGTPVPQKQRNFCQSAARRCDAAHRQFERVRSGLVEWEAMDEGTHGSPLGRRRIHDIIADAEFATIALHRAMIMGRDLSAEFGVTGSYPSVITAKLPEIVKLRNSYEHIDDRARGQVAPNKLGLDAEAAFIWTDLFKQRKIAYGTATLDIDQEATVLLTALRDYLVAAWNELVERASQAAAGSSAGSATI